jgi:hypothetical protein
MFTLHLSFLRNVSLWGVRGKRSGGVDTLGNGWRLPPFQASLSCLGSDDNWHLLSWLKPQWSVVRLGYCVPLKGHVLKAWLPDGGATEWWLDHEGANWTLTGQSGGGAWLEEVGHWGCALGGCIFFLAMFQHEVSIKLGMMEADRPKHTLSQAWFLDSISIIHSSIHFFREYLLNAS